MRKIFTENLKKRGKLIDWINCVGQEVDFVYDGIEGKLLINSYNKKLKRIKFTYKNKEFEMNASQFLSCNIGKIFYEKVSEDQALLGEWNFEKNNELNIYPYEVSKGSGKKVWWKCKKGHEWEAVIYTRAKVGCPVCSNKLIISGVNDIKTTHSFLLSKWNFEKNNELGIYPENFSYGSNMKVWWKCEKGHEWNENISNISNGYNCPFCSNRRVLNGYNDIETTHPYLIKFLKNKEDAKKYTAYSKKTIEVICPDCKVEKTINIYNLTSQGVCCAFCSDGISYSEKTMSILLNSLNISYEYQVGSKALNWITSKYRYDFYFELNNESYIIETNGGQHYVGGFERFGGRTLEEEQENDRIKKELALNNGIKEENYIVLDCRNSELEWIKNSILNSRLNEIFDLSSIDWVEIEKSTRINTIKTICEFYETNKDKMLLKDIAKHFSKSKSTIIKYLKQGNKVGWCDYDTKTHMKKVIRSDGKIFNSIKEGADDCGLSSGTSIISCCKNRLNKTGGYKWKYLEDYERLSKKEKIEFYS